MRGIRLILLSGVTVILVLAALQSGRGEIGRSASQAKNQPEGTSVGIAVTGVSRSIGEVMDLSELVIVATASEIGPPVWNSPDGNDWTADFEANPAKFVTSPMPTVPVTMSVSDVLALEEQAPPVKSGDMIVVDFLSTSLTLGEERVFFLDWTKLFMSEGWRETWFGNDSQGTWTVDKDGLATPSSGEHAFSVATAVLQGKVDGVLNEGMWRGSLEIDTLRQVLILENQSAGTAVAGFAQWPPDVAAERYEELVEADDPGAYPDPGDV